MSRADRHALRESDRRVAPGPHTDASEDLELGVVAV